mgnify:CR=1 FL=1
MRLIDSHCHLYYEPYIDNLGKTIEECKSKNVEMLLSISVDLKTSKKNIEIASKYKEVYCTVGLHPNNISSCYNDLKKILDLYNFKKKIIGIGEAGIDLYRSNNNLSKQIECFEEQIEFSIQNNLPLIVHTRNAEKETIDVLKKFSSKNLIFVLHCFSGSDKFAKECLDLNAFISFSGIITFKNSLDLVKICKNIPMDRILVETDSPYLSPHPLRGKVNHPKNTCLVADKIAEIKQKNIDEIAKITTNNFNELFKINYKSI